METTIQPFESPCSKKVILAINDTLNVINGKWKLPILAALMFGHHKRFKDLSKAIPKITPKMLSKELKDLEANGMVKREVVEAGMVTVEYQLTPGAESFRQVLDVLVNWGIHHRQSVIGNSEPEFVLG